MSCTLERDCKRLTFMHQTGNPTDGLTNGQTHKPTSSRKCKIYTFPDWRRQQNQCNYSSVSTTQTNLNIVKILASFFFTLNLAKCLDSNCLNRCITFQNSSRILWKLTITAWSIVNYVVRGRRGGNFKSSQQIFLIVFVLLHSSPY